jgi:hypothetical protein
MEYYTVQKSHKLHKMDIKVIPGDKVQFRSPIARRKSRSVNVRLPKNYIERKTFLKQRQWLLIMDQIISQIKNFSPSEKSIDFVKISKSIPFDLSPEECREMWNGVVSDFEGGINDKKQQVEETKECEMRNPIIRRYNKEINTEFTTHHFCNFDKRMKIYSKAMGREDTAAMRKFKAISKWFQDKLDEWREVKQLEEFENKIKKLSDKLNDSPVVITDKWEQEDVGELVYEYLSDLYISNIYYENQKPYLQKRKPKMLHKTEAVLNILDFEKPKPEEISGKSVKNKLLRWSVLEIIQLLKGVYKYGEPNWKEIHKNSLFIDKSPYDISLKWSNLKWKMLNDINYLNQKGPMDSTLRPPDVKVTVDHGVVNMHNWIIAYIKKLEGVIQLESHQNEILRDYDSFLRAVSVEPKDKKPIEEEKEPKIQRSNSVSGFYKSSKPSTRRDDNPESVFWIYKASPKSEDQEEEKGIKRSRRRKYKKRKRMKDRSELPDATGHRAFTNTLQFLYSKYMYKLGKIQTIPNNNLPIFKIRRNKNKNIWKIKRRDRKREERRAERTAEEAEKQRKEHLKQMKIQEKEAERRKRGTRHFKKKQTSQMTGGQDEQSQWKVVNKVVEE